jgi:death-on-curing protein
MISYNQALEVHSEMVKRFGGADGVRDNRLLESALARPFMTFDGVDLYPTSIEKASAIIESIVVNHPFLDGNKRTGYTLGRLLLLEDNIDIIADKELKYGFVVNVASGQYSYEDIVTWLKANTAPLS